MESNIIVIPTLFSLRIGDITKTISIKPLSLYTTILIIKELENSSRAAYKKDITELAKELTGKEKGDFLLSALRDYQKISGTELLNTVDGYNRILSIVTKLSDEELKIVLEDTQNQETITNILKIALDIKEEEKIEVKEEKIEEVKEEEKKI